MLIFELQEGKKNLNEAGLELRTPDDPPLKCSHYPVCFSNIHSQILKKIRKVKFKLNDSFLVLVVLQNLIHFSHKNFSMLPWFL